MKTPNETRNAGHGARNGNSRIKSTLETVWNLKHIGMSRDDAHASRRFFKQHRHVLREESGYFADTLLPLLVAFGFLLLIIAMLTVQVSRRNDELSTANERIDHLQFEVKTLTHTVGEVYRGTNDSSPVTSPGGAQ